MSKMLIIKRYKNRICWVSKKGVITPYRFKLLIDKKVPFKVVTREGKDVTNEVLWNALIKYGKNKKLNPRKIMEVL